MNDNKMIGCLIDWCWDNNLLLSLGKAQVEEDMQYTSMLTTGEGDILAVVCGKTLFGTRGYGYTYEDAVIDMMRKYNGKPLKAKITDVKDYVFPIIIFEEDLS